MVPPLCSARQKVARQLASLGAKTGPSPVSCVPAQVSYDDVERLRPLAHMEKVRIPHFMQDQARYAQQLAKIMAVNQLTDEELRSLI